MPDYKQGKIYCLRSHQTDEIYIGSTTQTLSQRMTQHRSKYRRYLGGKMGYISSFKILEYEDAYIELIEMCPCSCRAELHRREGELIRENDCINKRIAGRTNAEWHKDNKERMKCYKKQYQQNNKEKIAKLKKHYYQKNKELILSKNRQYYLDNRKKMLERHKQYNRDNKEKIREKKKVRITCECGTTIRIDNIQRHRRSQKHFKLMDELRSL